LRYNENYSLCAAGFYIIGFILGGKPFMDNGIAIKMVKKY
jgi:hypothetical protein